MARTIRIRARCRSRSISRLLRENRGIAYMEFALVAPVLALFLLGVADLGQGFATRFALQQAAARTLEMATLGTGASDYAYLVPEAATAAGVTQEQVALDKWLECDGVRKDWTGSCTGTEQRAKYVKITINSTYEPLFGTIGYENPRADGTIAISSHASLRIQ